MMKFIIKLLTIFILFCVTAFSQIENVNANDPVYDFLKSLNVKGVINNFNDVTLPLSKKNIFEKLNEAKKNKDKLSENELGLLDSYLIKFEESNSPIIFSQKFPSSLIHKLDTYNQKYLYNYQDSLVSFSVNPLFSYDFLLSAKDKKNTHLLRYGGVVKVNYKDWFAGYLSAEEGVQFNNREIALNDKNVRQSFTFNQSKLNYYDNTEGYILVNKGIFNLVFGRERNLWGTGYIDKMVLSNNPQTFDFLKFKIAYKSLKYEFLHGWLVHPFIKNYVDSINGNVRTKPSKYIAISRLSINPFDNFFIGISQIIIYGNRPIEAAYLNPFLFWESAQRSLNDLDNSFLSFDIRSRIIKGMEISSSIILDDINFDFFKKGNWDSKGNRFAWQIGAMLTNPILFKNMTLKTEYTLLRPYVFSHYGLTKYSLTYTSNGDFLGMDLQPNSTRFTASLDYLFSDKTIINIIFKHSLHGNNIYNEDGELIRSVGGEVTRTLSPKDSKTAFLLAGDLEKTDCYSINLNYEFLYGLFWKFGILYQVHSLKENTDEFYLISTGIHLNFNY